MPERHEAGEVTGWVGGKIEGWDGRPMTLEEIEAWGGKPHDLKKLAHYSADMLRKWATHMAGYGMTQARQVLVVLEYMALLEKELEQINPGRNTDPVPACRGGEESCKMVAGPELTTGDGNERAADSEREGSQAP